MRETFRLPLTSRKFQSATEKCARTIISSMNIRCIENKKGSSPPLPSSSAPCPKRTPYIRIISNQKVIKMLAKFIPADDQTNFITCSSVNNFLNRCSQILNVCRPIYIRNMKETFLIFNFGTHFK